ncbi:hypothetical protein TNCV_2609381 [Trichonephila clavipes]|nr:hypothetical protein TNCV_2609381 [Trichonephila clavipes]
MTHDGLATAIFTLNFRVFNSTNVYLGITDHLVLSMDSFGSWSFHEVCNAKKGGNRLVPGLDYKVDALKLPNQALRIYGESLQTCIACRCPDRTQHLFCWPILDVSVQSLASNGPVVDSRDLNLVFGLTEATHNN